MASVVVSFFSCALMGQSFRFVHGYFEIETGQLCENLNPVNRTQCKGSSCQVFLSKNSMHVNNMFRVHDGSKKIDTYNLIQFILTLPKMRFF